MNSSQENSLCLALPVYLTNWLLQRLQLAFGKYLELNPIGIVAPGAGAVFSDYDAVIPDIVFVLNERWEKIVANDRFIAAPNLVIEVVSPGKENRNRDFRAKRGLYAKYGVEEYWIVDRENRLVTIFRMLRGNFGRNRDTARQRSVNLTIASGFTLSVVRCSSFHRSSYGIGYL